LLRRVLLGLVTALVVARLLVPGEDPGRTQLGTGVAGLGLVFLWLLAATGWGVWRAWSREGAWRGSLVEAGLLILVGVSFFSADQPGRYWYPGWLISWEWVGVFAAFCLVRQLFRSKKEMDGLLAAILAIGVSLAVTLPIQALAFRAAGTERLDSTVAAVFGLEDAGATMKGPDLRGPFEHPATLAGFLLLAAPALWIAGMARFRTDGRAWKTGFRGFALVAIAILVIGYQLLSHQPIGRLIDTGLDAWATTSAVIRERPWLGVGPGNFSREYPAFLTSAAQMKITEPPSFLLEIAANYGLIGLAAVVATIALFFWRAVPAMASGVRKPPEQSVGDSGVSRGANPPRSPESAGDSGVSQGAHAPRSPQTNWEFYLGGMAGLTLGFMLRFNPAGGWQALTV